MDVDIQLTHGLNTFVFALLLLLLLIEEQNNMN